jgi:hypothetical protein
MDPLTAASPKVNLKRPIIQSTLMNAILFRSIAVMAVLSACVRAQTINWGSEVLSNLRDSGGYGLDGPFVVELGAFDSSFTPDMGNLAAWFLHWNVFDRADFNVTNGYFSGTAQLQNDGTSNSLDEDLNTISSFAGLPAYLWIRNSDSMVLNMGREWLLVTDSTGPSTWTFPTATPGCCDNELPIQWSVSDLAPDETPLYGAQRGVQGGGTYTYEVPSTLQTYTLGAYSDEVVLPEPGSSVLVLVLGVMALLDRRRLWHR